MNVKKIVVAIDFSPHSDAALEHATAIARDSGGEILLAHVHEPVTAADCGFGGYPIDDASAESRLLQEVKPADPSVAHKHCLLRGNPADEIIKLAETEGADMVVLGTHGRTGLSRLLMGSVAEAVVRGAGCPVLTIKQPASKAAASE